MRGNLYSSLPESGLDADRFAEDDRVDQLPLGRAALRETSEESGPYTARQFL